MTKEELMRLLEDLLGPLPIIVIKHVDKYVAEGHTYKEIGRAAYYFIEIKKQKLNEIERFGLGLLRGYIPIANTYFDNLKKRQEEQARQMERKDKVPFRQVETIKRIRKKKGIDINEL